MEKDDCIAFVLKTNENHWFWELEKCKTVTVLLLCLKTYENLWFWEVEEHHSQVLDTPGLAKHCWQAGHVEFDAEASSMARSAVRLP